MRHYEIMYIIRPTVEEEARKALIEQLNEIFTSRDSEVTNVNEWGMKELAYEIEDHTNGYYVVVDVNATDEARAEFERIARYNENVIRFIVVRREDKE